METNPGTDFAQLKALNTQPASASSATQEINQQKQLDGRASHSFDFEISGATLLRRTVGPVGPAPDLDAMENHGEPDGQDMSGWSCFLPKHSSLA